MLDELMSGGEVLWQGHGALPGNDGWVSLHLADTAHLTMAPPEEAADATARRVLALLERGGAYFFRALSDAVAVPSPGTDEGSVALEEDAGPVRDHAGPMRDHAGIVEDHALLRAVWDLAWSGHVTGDTLAPVRALLGGGRTAHRSRRAGARSTRWSRTAVALASRPSMPTRSGPPTGVGRWSVVPPVEPDPTVRALATAEQLMDRYGVLTRGSVVAEGVPGGYAGVYRVLARAEEAGRVRRGYFVEHLGAAQFGSTGAVDRLRLPPTRRGGSAPPGGPRSTAREDGAEDEGPTTLVLAATDPASPFGASVPWPDRPDETEGTHRPGRKAGAIVVTVDGELAVYLERGGRTALTYTQDVETLSSAAGRLAEQVRRGRLAGLTVGKIDGAAALADSALSTALQHAGFHTAPQGLRLRR